MASKVLCLAILFVKAIAAQRTLPLNYQQLPLTEIIIPQHTQIPTLSAAESDVLCKNFASAIQGVILDKFAQNCYKKPVFNQIASPIINEIATSVCSCPHISQAQPTIKQYLVTGISPSTSGVTKIPANYLGSKSANPTSNLLSLSALANLLSTGVPTAGIPTTEYKSAPILAALKADVAKPEPAPSSGVDMELLNNLAVALQLMIVNNILNSPPSEPPGPEPVVVPGYPIFESREPVTPISVSYAPVKNSYSPPTPTTTPAPPVQPQPYHSQNTYEISHQTYSMPNSNFVGSSGFADVNPIMSSISPNAGIGSLNSRSGLTLMSPYEALSPTSPFSDPMISSSYGSFKSSKKDFQSPYTSILQSDNNNDLFSMNDLF
ncbi:uncharacterized protein ACR2FA_010886 [Aphomia sociella]